MHNHDFIPGDIFYTIEEGQYQPYKLLKADEYDTWHVMGFGPVKQQPTAED
ncbi:MAG: hypothetical protein JST39_13210, partial [Bacteroidetes bacterium]|nr:hypothetical protein [Bacteroidota bacterium]